MPAQLQTLRRRIRSVASTRKITKAQELVATSRIGRAQERMAAFQPYADEITKVLSALASHATLEHPLLVPRPRVRRVGVLLITSDRGLAGGYNANAIRTAEQLIARLSQNGTEVLLYVVGRKGVTYYRFRNRPIAASWTGFSERPGFMHAREIGDTLVKAFLAGADGNVEDAGGHPSGDHGIDELHLVYTRFRSLMTQSPEARLLAPLGVSREPGLRPAYDFEPDSDTLLAAMLPKYINNRIFSALLDSAVSESASRRRAMKSATDNADELITKYTRDMNSARQAGITQEISEIVGGANALAAAGGQD